LRLNNIILGLSAICIASIIGIILFVILGWIIPAIAFCLLAVLSFLFILRQFKDIADTKNAEIGDLRKLIEKKDNLVADFSHKVRTPLNNFSIIIDLLTDTKPDDHQRELLETLIASTSNMTTAVNDFTVDSAREISFDNRKSIVFNLDTTLHNTVELFNMKSNSGQEIKIMPQDSPLTKLKGDPISIKQIFLDILNSIDIKSYPDHSIVIGYTTRNFGKDGILVEFTISSDKPVISVNYNPEEPENNSLAAKIILSLGGTISLSGKDGSSLGFSLPMKSGGSEQQMTEAAKRIKELSSVHSGGKNISEANILLVEDNPTNQKIVMISLSPRVKSIDTAGNGKEALDKFGKSNYDLILMDVQLPVMDGITAVEKIRELEASTSTHTPVIAITANAMLGDKEKCISAGMDAYLSKPFHPNELVSLIEELLSA
jgi:CheY-like chemotaxis protein